MTAGFGFMKGSGSDDPPGTRRHAFHPTVLSAQGAGSCRIERPKTRDTILRHACDLVPAISTRPASGSVMPAVLGCGVRGHSSRGAAARLSAIVAPAIAFNSTPQPTALARTSDRLRRADHY